MPTHVKDFLDSLMPEGAPVVGDTVDSDNILRLADVEGQDLKWFIDQMANGNALLFYGKAYKLFKRLLADEHGYKAEMIKEDEKAWLESRWVSKDNPDIHVDFRFPFENDKGTGKRVTLDGWTD